MKICPAGSLFDSTNLGTTHYVVLCVFAKGAAQTQVSLRDASEEKNDSTLQILYGLYYATLRTVDGSKHSSHSQVLLGQLGKIS